MLDIQTRRVAHDVDQSIQRVYRNVEVEAMTGRQQSPSLILRSTIPVTALYMSSDIREPLKGGLNLANAGRAIGCAALPDP